MAEENYENLRSEVLFLFYEISEEKLITAYLKEKYKINLKKNEMSIKQGILTFSCSSG